MSDDPDEADEPIVSYARRLVAKRRGVSDFFDLPDKSMKELEAARTAFEEAGIPISELRTQPELNHPPPDCQAFLDQGPVGIEVTELVSQVVIERYKRDGTSLWKVWSKNAFLCQLAHIIAKKDRAKDIRGGPYSKYFLVVHTDELAIKEDVVRPWLAEFTPTTALLDEVFLLLSYEPETKRCPVIKITIQKTPAASRQPS
jgi:hypothetical protein